MGLQGYVGSAADQARVRQLEKEREQDRERIDAAKKASASAPSGFRSWQKGETAVVEQVFKQETIGLVSRDKYIEKKSTIQARLEAEATKRKREEEAQVEEARVAKKEVKSRERKTAKLSFVEDDDDGDDDGGGVGVAAPDTAARAGGASAEAPTIVKNDEVPTDFLPDAKRQRAMEDMRVQLKAQWLQEQEDLKRRPLTLRFSYWDGSGHQREASVTTGDTVGAFLKAARAVLEGDFPNLRHVTVPNLLCVRHDVMLPQSMTFYTLLVGRARNGKGQALFEEGGVGDREKAHATKVVQRGWYESNKHIYPAASWELFEEAKHIKV